MVVEGEILIAAPVERVFDCWAALERSPEHQPATIERRKLTDGPVGRGTRYRAADRWPGRTVRFEMELTSYERPRMIAATWDTPMAGGWEASFAPAADSDQTRMEFRARISPSGVRGLLEPLLRRWAQKQVEKSLESFRDWIEAGGC